MAGEDQDWFYGALVWAAVGLAMVLLIHDCRASS